MEKYDEIRIEIQAGEVLRFLQAGGHAPAFPFKHNNTFIAGHKDIGLNGWITFVLRKQEVKHGTNNEGQEGQAENQP